MVKKKNDSFANTPLDSILEEQGVGRLVVAGLDAEHCVLTAIQAAAISISLVMRVPAPLKPIADQVIQSASSVPANLAEGAGRSGRDRM